jgi:lipopolysaccharide transport system permease protein
VVRELRARYRGSLLGFLWTFLNPTLLMLVYALVFSVYMRQQVVNYTYFMFVGLLPWIYFTGSVTQSSTSITDRRDLLTKVRFPAQILPATVVVTNLLNYFFSLPLMVVLGLAYRVVPTWHVVAFPAIVAVQTVFILAVSYVIAAMNVVFRDLQHVTSNLLTLWFFVTPVLYPVTTIPADVRQGAILANPMAVIATSYQDIFYDHRLPAAGPLALVAALSMGLLVIAAGIFERRQEEFAELV